MRGPGWAPASPRPPAWRPQRGPQGGRLAQGLSLARDGQTDAPALAGLLLTRHTESHWPPHPPARALPEHRTDGLPGPFPGRTRGSSCRPGRNRQWAGRLPPAPRPAHCCCRVFTRTLGGTDTHRQSGLSHLQLAPSRSASYTWPAPERAHAPRSGPPAASLSFLLPSFSPPTRVPGWPTLSCSGLMLSFRFPSVSTARMEGSACS